MATILQMRKRVQSLASKDVIEAILLKEVARFTHILIDLQQIRLSKGESTLGELFGTYSKATELESLFGESKPRQAKKEGDPYNYEWTGGLFDEMFASVKNKSVILGSTDPKSNILTKKFDNFYGLDFDSQVEFVSDYLYPSFIKVIKSKHLAIQ